MQNDRFIGEGDSRWWHWSCEESQEVVPVVRWSRYECPKQGPVLKINNYNMSLICVTFLLFFFYHVWLGETPILF